MFTYPSMPPNKTAMQTAPESPRYTSTGPHLILFSLASVTVAAGLIASRLLLSEMGEVLLLLSNNEAVSLQDGLDEIDYNYYGRTTNFFSNVGKTLIVTSSSLFVRSATVVFIFLSSAAFVLGMVLIRNELCYYASKLQPLFGKDWNKFLHLIEMNILNGRKSLKERLVKTIECVDGVVADDIIRTVVKMGTEIITGVAGGIILYSLPDQIFPQDDSMSSSNQVDVLQTQNSRRRIIYATDPSLGDVLFRPGGLWSIAPGVRDYLVGLTWSNIEKPLHQFVDAPTVDSTANDSDSCEDDKETSHQSLPTHIHVSQSQQHQTEIPRIDECNNDRGRSRGTIFEVTSDKIKYAATTFFENINNTREQDTPTPTPPPIQFEKLLQRSALTAAFCFALHLHKSPSTRKTWRSATHFLISCGLLSTAVSTGLASILSSNVDNSIVGRVCLNALEGMACLPYTKVRELLNKFRETVKSDRRLQMVLAVTVMYSLKRSNSSRRGRNGNRSRPRV